MINRTASLAHTPRLIPTLLVGAAALLIAVLLLPWQYPLYLDAAAYTEVGRLWLRDGAIPYRDVWEAKPPLALLFNGLAAVFGSATPLGVSGGVRLASALSAVGAGLALAWVLRGYAIRRGLAWAAALAWTALLVSPMHANGGGLTEVPAFAAGIAAWGLALRAAGSARLLAVGALSASAIAIHPQSVPLAIMAIISLLLADSRGAVSRRLSLAGLGGCLVAVVILAYFAAFSALDDLVMTVVGYSSALASVSCPIADLPGWPCFSDVDFGSSVLWHVLIIVPPLVPALLALATRRGLARAWPLLVFAVLMAALAVPMMRRSPTTHYMWPLLLATLVVIAAGADELWQRISTGAQPRLRLVAIALIAGVGVSGMTAATISATRVAGALDAADAAALAVADALPDEQPLFVWGTSSSLYEVSRRAPAGTYVHLFPLMLPGYTDADLVQRACETLARERPVIIDDGTSIGLTLGSRTPEGLDAAWFAPVRQLVASEWQLIDEIGGTRVLAPLTTDPLSPERCR